MNLIKRFLLVALAGSVTVGLVGCDKQNSAETAGKKIDQATSQVGQKMDEASQKLDQKSDQVAGAFDDTAITAKAKAAIFAEPGLKMLQINVDTIKGVVTLSGSVDSPQNSDRANAIAGAVAGVSKVENRLIVTSPN